MEYYREDAPSTHEEKNVLYDRKDEFVHLGYNTEGYFYLPSRTLSKYLKVDNARADGWPVLRGQTSPGKRTSVLAIPEDTLHLHIKFDNTEYDANEFSDAMLRGIRGRGFDARNCEEGAGNDLVIDGKKVVGWTNWTGGDENRSFFSAFLTLEPNPAMYRYFDLPNQKFEDKQANDVDDRIGGLRQFDDVDMTNLSVSIQSAIAETVGGLQANQFDFETLEYELLMQSDSEIFNE